MLLDKDLSVLNLNNMYVDKVLRDREIPTHQPQCVAICQRYISQALIVNDVSTCLVPHVWYIEILDDMCYKC